jgi:hypothetical protein
MSFNALAEGLPAEQLFNYFSANCRTQGEFTRAAASDSIALMKSLQAIANDEDCKSISGAISQLDLLNQQIARVEKLNETQVQLASINAKEQELLLQLSTTTDSSTLASINAVLRDLQIERAGIIGKENAVKDLQQPDQMSIMTSLISISNAAFTQISKNEKCVNKNPQILTTITSVVAAVGAAASVVNPALGLGLAAGATFLGQTVESFRINGLNRKIRRIADTSIAMEAYKCAIETMSYRWCDMDNAESFLHFKAKQRQRNFSPGELARAIRLNDREIPVLLNWLDKVRAGVKPSTISDSDRQKLVFQRDSMVRAAEALGYGVIEENRRLYDRTDVKDRWALIRTLIIRLIPSTSEGNPLYNVFPITQGMYFLAGIEEAQIPRAADGSYIPLDFYTPSISPTLKTQYFKWVDMARVRVNLELTNVLQPDTLQILTNAYDRSDNNWKLSPMDSLKNIKEFLETLPPETNNLPVFKRIYADTLNKLEVIYRAVEDGVIQSDSRIYDNSPLQTVYDTAQLSFGVVVLQTRLEMIIRQALLRMIENSKPEDQNWAAQVLAADRFTDVLTKMSGTDNLALIQADINRAKPMTISNLESFTAVFGKNINKILKRLVKEESKSTGTVARSKKQTRTDLCYLLLASPTWPKKVNFKYCEGLQFSSIIPGGPKGTVISKALINSDFSKRACIHRDFFRDSKIFERWGIQSPTL